MIVRVSGEDQYRLEDDLRGRLNELENTVIAAVESREEDAFEAGFTALLDFVRANGTRVGDEDIETSELILPPADITLAEAEQEFTGEGLIPD